MKENSSKARESRSCSQHKLYSRSVRLDHESVNITVAQRTTFLLFLLKWFPASFSSLGL